MGFNSGFKGLSHMIAAAT